MALTRARLEKIKRTRRRCCSETTRFQPLGLLVLSVTLCILCNIWFYFNVFDAKKFLLVWHFNNGAVCLCSPPLDPPLIQWLFAPGRTGVGTERNTLNHVSSGSQLESQHTPPPHSPGLFMEGLRSSGSAGSIYCSWLKFWTGSP